MSLDLHALVRLVALSAGYWLLDVAIRRGGADRLVAAARSRHRLFEPLVWAAALAALAAIGWEHVPHFEVARVLTLGLLALLIWKVVTEDIDPATGDGRTAARLGLIAAGVGACFRPALLVVGLLLLTRPFDAWRHHAILPLRAALATAAYVVVSGLAAALPAAALPYAPDGATLVFLVATIHASHYASAGLAKLRLGRRWYSWVLENRIDHMAANAYAWGWGRRFAWPIWHRFVRALRFGRVPLQAGALALELLAPIALLAPEAAVAACILWSAFHLGVLACGGFWFWDWLGADLVLALAVFALPGPVREATFGWPAVVASVAFIAVFPMRNRLWGPTLLAWWETPFTQRFHWLVHGRSGRTYEVHGDFMGPHERLYAKIHACFMAPVPLITGHLGTVWDDDHRDAVRAAGADPDRLNAVRARHGVQPRDERLAENHLAYLRRFFGALNAGARKHVLPAPLRWLRAPGSHLYYGGDLPAYRGQEPVTGVTMRFREQYYDEEKLVTIRDEAVHTVTVDAAAADQPCASEPLSRDVEIMLAEAFWRRRGVDYQSAEGVREGARLEQLEAK
ncbi:MAG: hypothetical protein IPK80_34215 [Nannocystis sp.]|nr:hypothetical protein [Nannocystis sp.]